MKTEQNDRCERVWKVTLYSGTTVIATRIADGIAEATRAALERWGDDFLAISALSEKAA